MFTANHSTDGSSSSSVDRDGTSEPQLLTGGLLVRVQPEEPVFSNKLTEVVCDRRSDCTQNCTPLARFEGQMRLDKFAGDSRRRRRIRVQSDTLHQLHDHVVQVGGDPAGRRQTAAPAECTPASFDVELLHVILVFSASSPPRLVFERGARDDQGLHTVAAPGGAETQVAAQRAAADAGAAWRVARPGSVADRWPSTD